jgi:hypothetical protein
MNPKPRVYIRTAQNGESVHEFSDNESARAWFENCRHLPGVEAVLREAGDERPVTEADWKGMT